MSGESVLELLRSEHYAADWVKGGDMAETALRTQVYDLDVLDLGLPRKDGMASLHTLRARRARQPMLIVTATDVLANRIDGLDAGADDYLRKPFAPEQLLARIRALLRRAAGRAEPVYEHRGVSIDLATWEVAADGQPDVLSSREWAVLEPVLARPSMVLSRAQIVDKLLQQEGRCQQQCRRGLHPRPAQEARRRHDPQQPRCRLHGAQGLTPGHAVAHVASGPPVVAAAGSHRRDGPRCWRRWRTVRPGPRPTRSSTVT